MKTRSVPRLPVILVLALTLAGAAGPVAWAAPVGVSGSHGPALDFGWVLDWFQGFFGGWLGGGEQNLESVTERSGHALEPDGADLRAKALVTEGDPTSSPASVPSSR